MNKHNVQLRGPQKGQAITETLIAMLAIVPLLIVIPYIGKYFDIKTSVIWSTRVAAMERTVHSNGNWEIGESVKSDSRIASDVVKWVQTEPGKSNTGSQSGSSSRNRLWRGREGENLLQDQNGVLTLTEQEDGILRGPVTEGLLLGKSTGSINWSGVAEVPLLAKNRNGLVTAEYALSAKSIPAMGQSGLTRTFERTGSGGAPIKFTDRLAVITDAWMPGSENNFADTTSKLVYEKMLGAMTFPGCLLWAFNGAGLSPFVDGRDCTNTDLRSDTGVILDKYRDRKNKRGKAE